jgi:hypothetical protein
MTYQTLFARILPLVAQTDPDYIAFLRDRYMSGAGGEP